jgi:hypothetical protein
MEPTNYKRLTHTITNPTSRFEQFSGEESRKSVKKQRPIITAAIGSW